MSLRAYMRTVLGSTTAAKLAAGDQSGTLQQYLRSAWFVLSDVYDSVNHKLKVDAVFEAGDIEIGAVELKNATDDTRAKVGPAATIAEGDNTLGTHDPALGALADAADKAGGATSVLAKLRGAVQLLADLIAKLPATLGPQTAAGSVSVTPAVDNAALAFTPDATMDEDLTSQTIDLKGASLLSVTLHADLATHVSTIYVDGSDDGINWNVEPAPSGGWPAASNGAAFDARLGLFLECRYARVRSAFVSGTGILAGTYTVKG